jgi:sulfotransferase family protein
MTTPASGGLAERVVIVLGPVRSGTTWLVELLRAHPRLSGLAWESTLFAGLWELWENAHRADGEGVAAYLTPDELAAELRGFCDGVFLAGISDPSGQWFVEKTPDNVNRLPLIAALYPDAWYIHLVRDGRDVVRSQVTAPWGTDDAGEAAHNWAWGVRQVREHRWRLPRFREVRYEDLLAEPVTGATSLLEWMGLAVDPETATRIGERVAKEVARYGATDHIGAGKWRDLDPGQLEQIERVAGPLLAELGYR